MHRFAAVLAVAALMMSGAAPAAVAAAPAASARDGRVVGVTAGQDRAQVEVQDGTAVLSGERAWPLGLRAPADGRVSAAAWRRMAAGALVRLGAPAEVAQSYAMAFGPAMQAAQPAGDLDGDGRDDILVTRWDYFSEGGSLHVQALRGTDGRELWSQSVEGFAHAVPAKVGPDARDGVVVVASTSDELGLFLAGVAQTSTTVQWLAGDGSVAVERTFQGHVAGSVTGAVARGVATNVELLKASGGRVTDALVTQLDLLVAPGIWRATATASVVSGADGAVVATATQDDEEGREPVAMAAGDLDGKDGADLVFTVADNGWEGTPGRLVASSSTDGTELWTRDDLPVDPWLFLRNPRDMTGDGRDELMFSSFGARTIVLDGASGADLWRRSAQVAYPAGDSDGDGRAEVGVMHMGYGPHRMTIHAVPVAAEGEGVGGIPPAFGTMTIDAYGIGTTESVLPARKVGLVTQVIDDRGKVLRSDRVLVDRAKGDHATRVQFERVGDVDGDGIPDAFAGALVADLERETVVSDRRLISGRTGATGWKPPLHTRAAGGAVDGEGDDVLAPRGRRVQVRDGLTGRVLWTAPARLLRHGAVDAADVSGDGRADLVITSFRGITVLDGRTGDVRWNVEPPPFEMAW